MPQNSSFTIIQPYRSTTAAAIPAPANLSTGEIAINLADRRLFAKDGGGSVVEMSNNPSTLNVTGGSITTTATSASIFDTTATGVSVFSAASVISIGAAAGTTTLRSSTLVGTQTTQTVFNTVATTVNAFSAATTLTIGTVTVTATYNVATGVTSSGQTKTLNLGTGGAAGSTTNVNIGSSVAGTTTVSSPTLAATAVTATTGTFSGTINANGGTIATNQTTANVVNNSATTVNAFGAATTINIGANSGTTTIGNNVVLPDITPSVSEYQAGFRGSPVIDGGTTRTFLLSDAGKTIYRNGGGAITYTIPADGTANFPLGTIIRVLSDASANPITVARAAGVALFNGATDANQSVAVNATALIQKISSNRWRFYT